jgi:hypothetical protein
MTLDTSYRSLAALSVKQDDLFRPALRCIEAGLYRAAHVMAFAAAMDYLHERLGGNVSALRSEQPKWKISKTDDLRDQSDFQVIILGGKVNALRHNEVKAWHGLLHRRNECAHPEDVYPGLNEALGYLDEIFKRIATLQKRPWP